ncbi:unknown [Alistipes sp. CAG:29]|nr:unknown [Alistipes sp. CAG:29]
MPRSICSVRLIGSHTVFHGTSVGNIPAASRPAEKYSNAVQ